MEIWRAPGSRGCTPDTAPLGEMVRIAIVGATGGVGKEALRQALDAGHDVVVFGKMLLVFGCIGTDFCK